MKKILVALMMVLCFTSLCFGAATVVIQECNGSGPTCTTVTAVRFCTTDAYNPTTTYPMVKPSSGSNYSYKKSTILYASTSPAGTINNIKWYTDGANSFGTGVTCSAKTVASYTQATGTEGTSGNQMTSGSDCFGYTSSAPLSVTGTISNPSTGKISGYVDFQAVLSTSVTSGTITSETISWKYDET